MLILGLRICAHFLFDYALDRKIFFLFVNGSPIQENIFSAKVYFFKLILQLFHGDSWRNKESFVFIKVPYMYGVFVLVRNIR